MESPNENFDVVIVGGGLAGMSLACLLGQAGIRTACIDQGGKSADLRTTAISYGSSKILDKAGIWGDALPKCPIESIDILDGQSPVLLNFSHDEIGGQAFGWIVLNSDLQAAMTARIKALKSITHITPATVRDFEVEDDYAAVILQDGQRLSTKLIIGADGRQSGVRDFMGVETRAWSYKQRAVICCVAHEQPHNNVAVEHFWPEGPFAILPMADDNQGRHRSSIVFTEHGLEKNSLMRFSDTEFETALAARFPERYGDVKLAGQRAAYPLGLIHATRYTAPRMALIADAAHGIHPIAGQGLNLGFRDVAKIAELIAASDDPGSETLLNRYERARRLDNTSMVAVTDGLNRLFSNRIPGAGLLRKAGLKAVSKLRPAKHFFMKQAMGDR